MKENIKSIRKLLIVLLILTIGIPTALGTPLTPVYYGGYAYLNGVLVPDDTIVSVEIYDLGLEVGNTTTALNSLGYNYNFELTMDDPDTLSEIEGAKSGDKLTFKINGIDCSIPEPGNIIVTEELGGILDLYVTTPDTTAPTVTDNTPTGTDIPVTTVITVTFDESMNTSSVEDAFSTNPLVAGTFGWDGDMMTFTPSADLAYSTTYDVTIGTGAEDLAGNPLETYIWDFTTGSESDTTAPTVIGNTPTGTDVQVTTVITVTFDESMNTSSVEYAFSTDPLVTGTFSWDGDTMTFTPSADLAYSTMYEVTIGTGAEDLADNPLAEAYIWDFTTEVVPTSNNLIQNPGFESGTSPWIFYTSETGTFSMASPGFEGSNAAKLALNNGGKNIQLYQKGLTLEPDTRYWLSFSAKSNTGHDVNVRLIKHVSPYTNYGLDFTADLDTNWQTFTTEFTTTGFTDTVNDGRLMFWLAPFAASGDTYFIDGVRLEKVDFQDTTPPTVTGNEPTGTNVPVSTQIHMTFSEIMDQASAESAFSTSPATTGSFRWNGNIMTYTPDSDLASDTTYTVTVGTGAMDLPDNNMLVEHTWDFTTEVIRNPGFESGTSPWLFYTNGIGTFLNDASGDGSPHAGHITISQEGSNVQLNQPDLVLEPNTLYHLSFKAYSNSGHDLSISLHKHGSPYTNYGLSNYVVNLGTSWSEYSTQFTTSGFSGTVNDGRLRFWLSPYDAIGDQYFIDDVILVKGQGSLIDELTEIDSFHPPAANDPRNMMYNEWHYFNVIDEEEGLSLMTTLKLSGDIYDLYNSLATIVFSYSTPDGEKFIGDIYPITPDQVEFSSETPDLRIYSSTVTLTDEGYHVHVESADSQTVFNAMFKPFTEPAPFFIAPYKQPHEPDRIINWLVASPKMKVNGTLTTSKGTAQEKTYTLKNARGYHDHNWGYWLWQDDIGWDWGQASESKNHLDGNDVGKYAFCFGNVTNNEHTESRGAVLNIWKNKKIIAGFGDEEIQIRHYGMTTLPIPELQDNSFPTYVVLIANSGENSISISFSTEDVTPIPVQVGVDKYLVIWELTGTYEVSGCIDGKPVSYTSKGFMEYVA